MSGDNNINVFDDIQSLCREFRKKLKVGQSASIDEYLAKIADSAKETLFQNLLHLDIEFRRRRGGNPSSEEYTNRFPQFARLVRQAFFESTMMSQEFLGDTPDSAEPTVMLGMPAARKLGEYELLRELGRGGFGVVYEARHLQRGECVALKTLPTGHNGQSTSSRDAERLHKFRREFRTLCEINHPNLAGMQTLEVDGEQWFFTMDLIDGVDFLDYVRPRNQLDETRLRATLKQLVRGITTLHERGIVHRDLKPSNVLVSTEGQVVILDFGLVAELQVASDQTISIQTKNFAGTPRYAAPEQVLGQRTSATDWYALGVMLYEALTGEAPLKGSGAELIVKKQTEDAPRLGGRSEYPLDLAELTDRLVQRDPEQRPDAEAVIAMVGADVKSHDDDSTENSCESSTSQTELALIGRESQLNMLHQVHQQRRDTQEPVAVFVSGRSGEGKTSLANKFLGEVRRDGATLVLSGRCYDRESVPFKAIDCMIDALVSFLRSRPIEEVHQWLPEDIGMLAQLFPVLRRVEAIADYASVNVAGIDSRQIRYRAFSALRELLVTVSGTKPMILFVDDLQWGDADSAAALHELLKPPNAPKVMLLGTFRSDEADESPFLIEWRARQPEADRPLDEQRIEVAPLTEDQCLDLISDRLNVAEDSLRERAHELFQDTRGNPYFLEQLVEGFDRETGKFQAVPLTEIIHRKLDKLPDDATSLLEAIAIAGQAVALSEAASVAGRAHSAFATITHMRSERLVRLIGSGQQPLVDTYHDKIRESVLDELEDSRRRDLHTCSGEFLEHQENVTASDVLEYLDQDAAANDTAPVTTDRIFDLAYHFRAAGDARGFAYQLMAGEQTYRAYASEDAIEFLQGAEAILPEGASDKIRHRLWTRLADSHARLGAFQTAFDYYGRAIECAPSEFSRAMAHAGVAAVHQSLGQYQSATASYDQALMSLGIRRPKSVMALLKMLPLMGRVFLIPRVWQSRADEHQQKRDSLELKISTYKAQYIFEQSDALIAYPYTMLRMGALAIRSPDRDTFAAGMCLVGGHIAGSGMPSLGKKQLRKAAPFDEPFTDLESHAISLYASALMHANARELQLADDEFDRALPLLVKSGSHLYASACAHLQRHARAVIGTSSQEHEAAKKVLSLAEEVGNVGGQCWGHYDIASALARAGDLAPARDRIEIAHAFLKSGEMNLSETIFLWTKGYVLLQASDYDGARDSCDQSWRIVKRRKMIMEYTLHVLPLLIESLVGPDWLDSGAPNDAKRLPSLCRAAWLMHWFYPNLQSPIQRSRGRAFWVLGKKRKSLRCFASAVKCAADLGADYDRARSLLDLAAVSEDRRRDNRTEAIELLKKMESVIPFAEHWLLGDQYDPAVVAPPAEAENADASLGRGQGER